MTRVRLRLIGRIVERNAPATSPASAAPSTVPHQAASERFASVALMTFAMLATALLPTHAAIGGAAGWLLFLLRCVMGFSVGGEYSGVVAYLLEGARPERRGLVALTEKSGNPAEPDGEVSETSMIRPAKKRPSGPTSGGKKSEETPAAQAGRD